MTKLKYNKINNNNNNDDKNKKIYLTETQNYEMTLTI